MLSSLLISRKAVEISHTHVENYMHARAGLDFVSCHEPTKRSQPGGWQPPQKVATSIYCIIIQPFSSHLFLAHIRLIWPRCPRWYDDAIKNFRGGAQGPEVCWNRPHHCQEEDEMMARAGVLAFLLSGWQENGLMITRLGGYPKLFIIPVGHMGYHHYWLTV